MTTAVRLIGRHLHEALRMVPCRCSANISSLFIVISQLRRLRRREKGLVQGHSVSQWHQIATRNIISVLRGYSLAPLSCAMLAPLSPRQPQSTGPRVSGVAQGDAHNCECLSCFTHCLNSSLPTACNIASPFSSCGS